METTIKQRSDLEIFKARVSKKKKKIVNNIVLETNSWFKATHNSAIRKQVIVIGFIVYESDVKRGSDNSFRQHRESVTNGHFEHFYFGKFLHMIRDLST